MRDMTHPDITRMMETGLKPYEKYWYDMEVYDPWLIDREQDEDEDEE